MTWTRSLMNMLNIKRPRTLPAEIWYMYTYFDARASLYIFLQFSVAECPVLTVGRLVRTIPKSCMTSQMKITSNCSFSCPEGYQLQGPSYKQCGSNGQWTDSAKSVSCKGELRITGVIVMIATTQPSFLFVTFSLILWIIHEQYSVQILTSARCQTVAAVTSVLILQEAINVNVQIRNWA